MKFEHAIAELDIRASNAENNAPIHESEGNIEQAKLCRDTADSCRSAIRLLEVA